MYGVSPAKVYLGIEEPYLAWQVDLACSSAHWEDENFQYKDSQERSQSEAGAIGNELEKYRQKMNDR